MADERLKPDANYKHVIGGITNDSSEYVKMARMNPSTYRLLVENSAIDASTDNVGLKDSESGRRVEVSPQGELSVEEQTRLVGTQFEGTTIDTNFWTPTVVDTGTVTMGNGCVALLTGSGGSASAILTSVRKGRYIPAIANKWRGQVQLSDTGVMQNTRKWGAFTATDGAYFKLFNTTFSVNTFKTGTETSVASGSFNMASGSTYTLDTNVHTYEIYYNNKVVRFYIDDDLIHVVTASGTTWSDTLTLNSRMENTKTAGGTAYKLEARAATIVRLGKLNTQPTSYYRSGQGTAVIKYGSGNLHAITIGGVANTSVITLYDNNTISGVSLGTIWSSGAMPNNTNPFTIDMKGVPFFTGLTVGITTANCNATVIYE